MPLNVPGILAPLQFLVNPRIIVPNLSVKDIRYLDFNALKHAGYRGVVFDKDNCLTPPKEDNLVPDIEGAWKECREVFGEGNVIVVSNTAGAHVDAGGIQAESVRYHLGVPVLFHSSFKPAYSCVHQIRSYFRSLPKSIEDDELIVVGDRLLTDIVLASRLREKTFRDRFWSRSKSNLSSPDASKRVISKPDDATHALPTRTTLAVWTTGLWVKEATVMRFCERKLLEGVRKWVIAPAENRAEGKEVDRVSPMKNAEYDEDPLKRAFVREIPPPPPPRKRTILQSIVVFVQALQFRRSG
ncbi:HAD phosphatase [Lentinula raphanica]|uniref:HAD phosphatase n=1 Tax=Lentinula raphanica TaxID=153919 RepID=A0AA38UK47_9AGAR|nr:HAD phosphatase [Lentinula raphanica]KAJ3967932.1 HAD phosphatase [Lentinula raphanica]